jgi:hypothetical protein
LSSPMHPTTPENEALIAECYAATDSGDLERIDKAIARLDGHMCTSIGLGMCPCCRLTLVPQEDAFYCPLCGHLWSRNTEGSQITWYDRQGSQASGARTGNPAEADVPSQGTPQPPGQYGKDASHGR